MRGLRGYKFLVVKLEFTVQPPTQVGSTFSVFNSVSAWGSEFHSIEARSGVIEWGRALDYTISLSCTWFDPGKLWTLVDAGLTTMNVPRICVPGVTNITLWTLPHNRSTISSLYSALVSCFPWCICEGISNPPVHPKQINYSLCMTLMKELELL